LIDIQLESLKLSPKKIVRCTGVVAGQAPTKIRSAYSFLARGSVLKCAPRQQSNHDLQAIFPATPIKIMYESCVEDIKSKPPTQKENLPIHHHSWSCAFSYQTDLSPQPAEYYERLAQPLIASPTALSSRA
jgi:hypothetical protein